MNRIFVDTWAWFAINVVNDNHHLQATATNRELVRQKYTYVTTNFVLDETYTLIRRKANVQRAITFGYEIQKLVHQHIVELITITPDIEREAWHLFEMYESVNGLSYTDCTSFVVMQQFKLRQAFTNDMHFVMAGFERIPQ